MPIRPGQTLNLSTVGPVSNLSTGVLQASNGGTLNIAQAVTGTGTIQTDSGGKVVLNQSAQVGRLINNATLDVGDYNVTVSSDYNNANFGTGNSFNKHAGVVSYGNPLPATTGQAYILASGNVAQAVTGANVSQGTDASPTLTIGNVRVGGTTYNYQVANTGTDGPSIRGALQTGVNGGNITDSRLSGSGVTAGNYGPVGTGANSGQPRRDVHDDDRRCTRAAVRPSRPHRQQLRQRRRADAQHRVGQRRGRVQRGGGQRDADADRVRQCAGGWHEQPVPHDRQTPRPRARTAKTSTRRWALRAAPRRVAAA